MVSLTKRLKMNGEEVWKGEKKHNGTLLKVNENSYTIGYSALLSPNGTKAKSISFGDGVFYNANEKNNRVYTGLPTVSKAKGVFAGILSRESAIASGYPVNNSEVASYQNGLLIKEGFVVYKEAYTIASKATELSENKVNLYDNIKLDYNLVISSVDGKAYFSPDDTKATSKDVVAGKVIGLNPDDKSVTVRIFSMNSVSTTSGGGGSGGGGGITIVTTSDIEDEAVTADKLADNAVTTDKIENYAVTNAKIANSAVTADKIADNAVTTDKIVDGAITADKIADGVIPSGGGEIADNSVTEAKLASGAVTADKIADLNVTEAKLADGAVTNAKIKDANVTADKIADLNVTEAKLADGAITADKIADNAVTTDKIVDGAITADKIADLNVTEAKLADGAVTADKIADLNVTEAKLASNAVTYNKLADNAVTIAKIAKGAVTTARIADLNVTTAKIKDSAVTTDKIKDANVTTDKIANYAVTTDKIANYAVTIDKIQEYTIRSNRISHILKETFITIPASETEENVYTYEITYEDLAQIILADIQATSANPESTVMDKATITLFCTVDDYTLSLVCYGFNSNSSIFYLRGVTTGAVGDKVNFYQDAENNFHPILWVEQPSNQTLNKVTIKYYSPTTSSNPYIRFRPCDIKYASVE